MYTKDKIKHMLVLLKHYPDFVITLDMKKQWKKELGIDTDEEFELWLRLQ